MKIFKEFKEFLQEYKVIPLAIAFIMAAAGTALITAVVNDAIMPIIKPLLAGDNWKTAVFPTSGPIQFAVGDLLAAVINFIIIAFVVFLIAKYALREEKVTKK